MPAEIRSFVFTVVVVALGFVVLATLFTGGTGGVEQLFETASTWFLGVTHNVLNTVTGLVPEPSR